MSEKREVEVDISAFPSVLSYQSMSTGYRISALGFCRKSQVHYKTRRNEEPLDPGAFGFFGEWMLKDMTNPDNQTFVFKWPY